MELGLGEGAPNTWGQSSGVLAYYFRRSGCKGKRRALTALDSRGGSLVHEAPGVLRKVKTGAGEGRPLDGKEIKQVNPKRNHPYGGAGRCC